MDTEKKVKKFIVDLCSLVKEYWETSKVTMICKPLLYLLTIIVAAFRTEFYILIVVGILCVIVEFCMNTYETKKYEEKIDKINAEVKKVKDENSNIQREKSSLEDDIEVMGEIIDNHIESFLMFLFNELQLDRAARISVYHRDEVGENFKIISRYSSNPNYKKIGRTSYAGDKGFISMCWEGDSNDFIKILPKTNSREYEIEQSKVGYNKSELNELSMKSRIFYVLNIAKVDHPSIGVIVIESTNDTLKKFKKSKTEEDLQRVLSNNMLKYISYLYDLLDNKQIQKGEGYEK